MVKAEPLVLAGALAELPQEQATARRRGLAPPEHLSASDIVPGAVHQARLQAVVASGARAVLVGELEALQEAAEQPAGLRPAAALEA